MDEYKALYPNTIQSLRQHKQNVARLFPKMERMDFMILLLLAQYIDASQQDRIYLSDLAQKSQIPVSQISKVIRKLQNKGLVLWTHDHPGDQGTYIQITENGRQSVKEQYDYLRQLFDRVAASFGKDNLTELMRSIIRLDQILQAEFEQMEQDNDDTAIAEPDLSSKL